MSKKQLTILLILVLSFSLSACKKDVEELKQTMTKPYVDTLLKNTSETTAQTNNNTIKTNTTSTTKNNTTNITKTNTTTPAYTKPNYLLTLDKTFYTQNEDIEAELLLEKSAYIKTYDDKPEYKIYRFQDGEFRALKTGRIYGCYNKDCDDGFINEVCKEKPQPDCEKIVNQTNYNFGPYEWVEKTQTCEGQNAVFLDEEKLNAGIYKISYTLYSTSSCKEGIETSNLFVIQEP